MRGIMAFWNRFRRNRAALFGLSIVLAIIVVAIVAPFFYPDDPMGMVAQPFLWPLQDLRFPFGSDSLGRDLGAQIFHGAHVSLLIGATATIASVLIGVTIGSLAGY